MRKHISVVETAQSGELGYGSLSKRIRSGRDLWNESCTFAPRDALRSQSAASVETSTLHQQSCPQRPLLQVWSERRGVRAAQEKAAGQEAFREDRRAPALCGAAPEWLEARQRGQMLGGWRGGPGHGRECAGRELGGVTVSLQPRAVGVGWAGCLPSYSCLEDISGRIRSGRG